MSSPLVSAGILAQRDYDLLKEAAEQGQDEYVALARDLCHDNVLLWNCVFLGYDAAAFMVKVDREVSRYPQRMVRLPRDHSKSATFAIGRVAHRLAYSTLPGSRFENWTGLLIQDTATSVTKTIHAIRAIFEHNRLVRVAFGDVPAAAGKWTENMIWMPNRNGRVSKDPTLAGVGLRGPVTGAHPAEIVMDDVVSFENSKTPFLRSQSRDWFSRSVMGTIGPTTDVTSLYTPYWEDDLNGWLEGQRTFRVLSYPALNRYPSPDDFEEVFDTNGVRTGLRITPQGLDLTALWPCPLGTGQCPNTAEHYAEVGIHRSVEYILLDKFLRDPFGFASQFMLQIRSDADAPIKKPMLRFYCRDKERVGKPSMYNDALVVEFPTDPRVFVASVHGWDHAIGKKKKHDRTAVAQGYRTRENDVFFVNKAGRWDFVSAIKMMESRYNSDPVRKPVSVVSEGIAFQQAYKEQLNAQSSSLIPVETLGDLGVKGNLDKDQALIESGLLAHMMAGKVFIDLDDEDTIQELLAFPLGAHDDILDAMRICYTRLRATERRKARVHRSPPLHGT